MSSRQTRGHFQTASPAFPLAPATKQNSRSGLPGNQRLPAWTPGCRLHPGTRAGGTCGSSSSPPFHIPPDESRPGFSVFHLKPQPYSFQVNDLRRNSARAFEHSGASRVKLAWLCVLEHRLGFSRSSSPRVFGIRRGVPFSHCVDEATRGSQMSRGGSKEKRGHAINAQCQRARCRASRLTRQG